MKYLPRNTLAYFKAAPHFKAQAFGGVLVHKFAQVTQQYRAGTSPVKPTYEAIEFYALNHMAKVIGDRFTLNEPLPLWAQDTMQAYLDCLVSQTERLLHYNVSICTREMRHVTSVPAQSIAKLKEIHPRMATFIQGLKGSGAGEDGALQQYYSNPLENVSLTQYMAGMVLAFSKAEGCTFPKSYGGDPWANIAKCMHMAVSGATTLEMFVDTSYTLAHNTSSMFNKPLLYSFGEPDTPILTLILDVQRSGQMPELVLDPKKWGADTPTSVGMLVKQVKDEIPGAFGTFVDWFKVEALGAVGKYPTQKNYQKEQHPEPTVVKFMGKEATVVGSYPVWPGQSISILKRAA